MQYFFLYHLLLADYPCLLVITCNQVIGGRSATTLKMLRERGPPAGCIVTVQKCVQRATHEDGFNPQQQSHMAEARRSD